ncbi:MAG: insulinase family protein [Bryobacterales bacterium]|nr:insulinase family protein [Bryobacterales bacterium]
MGRWIAAVLALPLSAQNLADFEKRVSTFTLDNGLQFVVMERRDAPVVSFHTYVKSGSAQDPPGKAGMAHLTGRVALKGTPAIGSKDWEREKAALSAVEEAWAALDAERSKPDASASQIVVLEGRLKSAVTRAQMHAQPDEFTRLLEENGGTGPNTATGVEATEFSWSLPANRIELWFLMESERLLRPVFRDFFKERDAVRQEHEQRTGSNPQVRLIEALQMAAFTTHPYRRSSGGSGEEIARLGAADAEAYFRAHYTPANLVMAIVGDVDPPEVKRLAAKYFARLPKTQPPRPVSAAEPEQTAERRVPVESPSQPLLYLAFKRPDQFHKDDIVFDVIGTILAGGPAARLYRSLVNERRVAFTVGGAPTHPAGGAPCLFVLFAAPRPDAAPRRASRPSTRSWSDSRPSPSVTPNCRT